MTYDIEINGRTLFWCQIESLNIDKNTYIYAGIIIKNCLSLVLKVKNRNTVKINKILNNCKNWYSRFNRNLGIPDIS